MSRNALGMSLCLTALLVLGSAARADYEAGQTAWKAGQYAEALTQWEAAAGAGDDRAMLALGRAFVKGLGIPQDYVLAHKWLNLAAAQGIAEAAAERDALAAKMTPQQVASAQDQARAWRSSGKAEEPKPVADSKTESRSPTILPPKRAIREAQELMGQLGYKPGPADGAWGPRSERAYAAFLRDAGMPPEKILTLEALRVMRGKAGKEEVPTAVAKAGAETSGGEAPLPTAEGKAAVASSTPSASTPAENCDGWNTKAFFEQATREKVAGCLQAGADLHNRTEFDNTPLHLAAWRTKDPAVVAVLVEAGADHTARNKGKLTPLHAAALNENPAVVAALIKVAADLKARDKDDRTPLHMAARYGTPAVTATLLKAGADPNARDRAKEIPLHLAARSNVNPAVIAELLKGGAHLEARDKDERTPLYLAASFNRSPSVSAELLNAGADLGARNRHGYTALQGAAWSNRNPAVVIELLKAGADLHAEDKFGATPLHLAARYNETPAVVDVLIKAGASLTARARYQRTPLHSAARNKNPAVAIALIEAGADLHAGDLFGRRPLQRAAGFNENPAVTSALLAAGADPNARDDRSRISLHTAAEHNGNLDVIGDLLKAGADPNARDKDGKTPVDLAAKNENPGVLAALEKAAVAIKTPSGDPTARDKKSRPSLRRADESGDRAEASAAPRIPVDATHCVKLHETSAGVYRDEYADGSIAYELEAFVRDYENTCNEPIVLRVRYFSKRRHDRDESYVLDTIVPGRHKRGADPAGTSILVDNVGLKPRGAYAPLPESAYCAEYVDMELTPEYLYNAHYRAHDGGEFGTYNAVVDHLRRNGVKVGPEMRAYYDAYFDNLEHSPCYAHVVREPPLNYEHFPPLDWYQVLRMSTFVNFSEEGGGFSATSFDEEADFGGVSFHDVGGTETHYISDLPKPVRR